MLEMATDRQVVILHEQANQGRTLIEKFEHHAGDASFAIVILTADDEGRARGDSELRHRGRQNVIFEMGFFFASLGRQRVVVLLDPGVEQPSDVQGLLYISIDNKGPWKSKLARELVAAAAPGSRRHRAVAEHVAGRSPGRRHTADNAARGVGAQRSAASRRPADACARRSRSVDRAPPGRCLMAARKTPAKQPSESPSPQPKKKRTKAGGSTDLPPRATYGDTPYRDVPVAVWADLFDQILASTGGSTAATAGRNAAVADTQRRPNSPMTIPDARIEQCIASIHSTHLVPLFALQMERGKRNPGRPSRFSPLAVLVALWWCAIERRPPHLSEVAKVLTLWLSAEMERVLDVRTETIRVPVAQRHNASAAALVGEGPSADYTDLKAAERAVGRTFRRMLDTVDPSVLPKGRRMPHADLITARRDVPREERIDRQAALDWVCNQLLQASYEAMSEKLQQQWENHPSGGLDATPMKSFARLENGTRSSADPDAGPYKRYSQMNPDKVTKHMHAYDLHVFVAGDDQPGDHRHVPGLVLGITSDRPGVDPSGASRRLMATLHHRGLTPNKLGKPGFMAGDRLYTGQQAEHFQMPAKEVGFDLVLDYRNDQLGIQSPHTSGMSMVEGDWYCPAMTRRLIAATEDYRAGRIDLQQYHAEIHERNLYRMRMKEKADANGTYRVGCPASGSHPLAVCVNKPRSLEARNTRQPDGSKADTRPEIVPAGDTFSHGRPQVCLSESVSVKREDGAKYRQTLPFGTDEHHTVYASLRNNQEGAHGFAKDEAQEALGAPGRRRVHGKAAQTFYAALLLAAANMRKIASFEAQAVTDRKTGLTYVIKKKQHRPNRWATDPASDVSVDPAAAEPRDPGVAA